MSLREVPCPKPAPHQPMQGLPPALLPSSPWESSWAQPGSPASPTATQTRLRTCSHQPTCLDPPLLGRGRDRQCLSCKANTGSDR